MSDAHSTPEQVAAWTSHLAALREIAGGLARLVVPDSEKALADAIFKARNEAHAAIRCADATLSALERALPPKP